MFELDSRKTIQVIESDFYSLLVLDDLSGEYRQTFAVKLDVFMDSTTKHSKNSISSTSNSNNGYERSSSTSCHDSYVYTGPLTSQYHEMQSKQFDGSSSSSSPSTNNPSLSSSPSTEIVSSSANHYQFKVMLLGDSGVGKFVLYSR